MREPQLRRIARTFSFRAHSFSFPHFFSSALFFFRQIPRALFFCALVRAFFLLSCVRGGDRVRGGNGTDMWRCATPRTKRSTATRLLLDSTKLLRVGVRACACVFQVRFDGEREEQGLAPVLDSGWAGRTEGRRAGGPLLHPPHTRDDRERCRAQRIGVVAHSFIFRGSTNILQTFSKLMPCCHFLPVTLPHLPLPLLLPLLASCVARVQGSRSCT